MTTRIITGDARTALADIPDGSIQCCVTSPPYFGLRSYLPTGHDGKHAELGAEPTLAAYVANLVAVFREVRRVLRDDGTLFLNLGDSYNTGGAAGFRPGAGRADGIVDDRNQRNRNGTSESSLKPKDLMMVPARVALALQEPYENVQITDRVDRAWLAALVDGEGCVTILESNAPNGTASSYPPILQVRMCDPEPIVRCQEITGYGSASPKQDPPSQGGVRGSYQWRINGRKAADILAEIYPYLLVKRKQAMVAWNHQRVRDSYPTGKGVPASAVEKQIICRTLIQQLNRREHVDLPSWMTEPQIVVEPGWYLRSSIIWHKTAPMPESVTDRPTSAHEHIFLLTKRKTYYYDADAVKEPPADSVVSRAAYKSGGTKLAANGDRNDGDKGQRTGFADWQSGRNQRNVWTLGPAPYAAAHFATFPPEIPRRCILAGTSERGQCTACGAPWTRVVERTVKANADRQRGRGSAMSGLQPGNENGQYDNHGATIAMYDSHTTGWSPSCACGAGEPVPQIVLDPFSGAGTTGLVANRLGRHYIGIELNPEYVALSESRIRNDAPLFAMEVV